jgi:hypothetical protein
MSVNAIPVLVYGFFIEEESIDSFESETEQDFDELELPEGLHSFIDTIKHCTYDIWDGSIGAYIGIGMTEQVERYLRGEEKVDFSPLKKWMDDIGLEYKNPEPKLFLDVSIQ